MREKVRVYPEPIELAHLALKLKPALYAKGKSGWLESLQNARDYYDDAVEAAIIKTNRDRSELRLKLQRQHAAELISQIEAGGFLRFQPRGSGGDEFRSELQKQELEGLKRADGYWFQWDMQHGDPETKRPDTLMVSTLLLDQAIKTHKQTKLFLAQVRRKRPETSRTHLDSEK